MRRSSVPSYLGGQLINFPSEMHIFLTLDGPRFLKVVPFFLSSMSFHDLVSDSSVPLYMESSHFPSTESFRFSFFAFTNPLLLLLRGCLYLFTVVGF